MTSNRSEWATFCTFLTVLALSGCADTPQSATTNPTPAAQFEPTADAHGHTGHSAGPHAGTLADWGGGKYHVEFTVDHDKQEVTVFVLGDDEKSPSPIKATEIQLAIKEPMMQIALKAAPLESDPVGFASRFVGQHESLSVVREYAGTITGVVDDTPYSGDFQEEPHGTHDHK